MVSQQRTPFAEGDVVRILAGPFSGFRATVDSIGEDLRIVKVILRCFGKARTAEIFIMDLKKID